jgi:hypothetical protein
VSNLTYLPVPVDPRTTDQSVRRLIDEVTLTDPGLPYTKCDRVFWLFAESLNRFDDEQAKIALERAMKYSDGMAIIELQDRRLGCMIITLFTVLFWILLSPVQLLACLITVIFTIFLRVLIPGRVYAHNRQSRSTLLEWVQQLAMSIWILPALIVLDDVISCLGTREFEEVIHLVKHVHGLAFDPCITTDKKTGSKQCDIGDWEFHFNRQQYAWPFCHVNMIFGLRKQEDLRRDSLIKTAGKMPILPAEPEVSRRSSSSEVDPRAKRNSRHDSMNMLVSEDTHEGSKSGPSGNSNRPSRQDIDGMRESRKSSLKFKSPGERAKDKLELDSQGNPIAKPQWSVKDFRIRKRRSL